MPQWVVQKVISSKVISSQLEATGKIRARDDHLPDMTVTQCPNEI